MSPLAAVPIAFAGTPEFAVPALDALIAAGAAIDCVLTQPDRPSGRGRRLTASPVKVLAATRGISVQQPQRLDAAARTLLPARRPELLVVIAYGLILPQWLLDWPVCAAINVHASLLPRWRGAAPVQHAILAGDVQTGISIMRMSRGLDSGPVYRRQATPIGVAESAGELLGRLADSGAALLLETLPGILDGSLAAEPQDETAVTWAPKIAKSDALIDWRLPAVVLARRVRAFNPWPVAETRTATGDRLRIWRAEALAGNAGSGSGSGSGAAPGSQAAAAPGTVLAAGADGIDVATGDGILRLERVQPPGAREMSAAAWLAARSLDGQVFAGTG